MSRLVATAVKLPLAWAMCYTAGLPAPLRETRRAEIRSDTFEHSHDPTLAHRPVRHAWDIIQSFLRGLPDDLRWRAVNTPGGLWIVEVTSLSLALSLFFTALALAQTDAFTSQAERIAIGLAGAGLGLGLGIWCAIALRAGNSNTTLPAAVSSETSAAASFRGNEMTTQSFARWSGWLLIAAGLVQALSFALGRATGYDYFAGTEEQLNTIAADQGLFIAAAATAALATPLLLPFFVYLALAAPGGERAWQVVSSGLFAVHLAVSMVGLALFAVLIPLAEDFASASGARAETLLAQAETFEQLQFIVIQPAGVAMAAALAFAAFRMRKEGIGPRWLLFVGLAHAITWLPPFAGGFILTFPLFVVWAISTGLILVRQNGQRMPLVAPMAA